MLALALSCARAVELSERETKALRNALQALNATECDLGFQKDLGEPRSALSWIRQALNDPLRFNPVAQALWESARNNEDPNALWEQARILLEVAAVALPDPPEPADVVAPLASDICPASLREPLAKFFNQSRRAKSLVRQAVQNLSVEEQRRLAVSTFGGVFRLEHEEKTRRVFMRAGIGENEIAEFIRESDALDARPGAERFFEAAQKFDLAPILAAGRALHQATRALADAARSIQEWPGHTVSWDEPDLGRVVILGTNNTEFAEPAFLVLAPRGNQRYRGAVGAANGLAGLPLAVLIDLDGNDLYESHDLVGPGAALMGISVVIDEAGDDTWRLEYAGAGAGFWGAGILEDRAGNDVRIGRAMGQGAAFAGVGLLIEHAGNDRYEIGLQGQGFSGWRGFGMLIDRAGHDVYYAGGLEPDHERNPDRFLSLSQGFSMGMRPFAGGGVAALIDLEGNDLYFGDVFAQGVSYYYSAGLLIDGGGHDRYLTHHYGQGCGIHLSLGLLADLGGHDRYIGGILAQGAGHDFAVGMLIDREGDDLYSAALHAQGHGMNNSVGLLIDSAGDDIYDGRDPQTTQGVGNTGGFRESGSIGVLIDLGGNDRYSCGARNDDRRVRPLYGTVFDGREEAEL